MALGASRESNSLLILRDTARMAAVGLALGLLLSVGATRLETSVLFGVRPLDALSLFGAIGVLSYRNLTRSMAPRAARRLR